MGENAENLLILILFVFAALLTYMLIRPKQRSSSKLNLRQSLADGKLSNDGYTAKYGVREVNVIFQFNGHDFDAYQVLGLPAGSSWDSVQSAFKKSIAQMDPDSHELLEMAMKAIKQQNENF